MAIQITLENGQIMDIFTDPSSVEMAFDKKLKEKFNFKMEATHFMLGFMVYTTKRQSFAHTDVIEDFIDPAWFSRTTDPMRYYSYSDGSYSIQNKMGALISLVKYHTKELYDSLYNTSTPVFFVLVINKV